MRRWLCLLVLLLPLAAPAQPAVLVMGDSLGSGYGLDADAGWVALLERRLRAQGYRERVVNASVTGETTAGGLSRLPAALAQHQPSVVLIELGGNDGLRGLPVAQMRGNLERMVALSKKAGARVLLFEMRMPPNYGAQYTGAFRKTFAELANAQRVGLVPFFLESIALEPGKHFLEDGIHPNAAAQPLLLDAVWPRVQPWLDPKRPEASP